MKKPRCSLCNRKIIRRKRGFKPFCSTACTQAHAVEQSLKRVKWTDMVVEGAAVDLSVGSTMAIGDDRYLIRGIDRAFGPKMESKIFMELIKP